MKPWLWLGFAAVLFALGGCAKPATNKMSRRMAKLVV